MIFKLSLIAMVSIMSGATAAADLVILKKDAFTLSYDCDLRSAVRYEYSLGKDRGSASRPESFNLDPDLPDGCEGQFSTQAYAAVVPGWDRGHLVTSNHMDMNSKTIMQANLMSNIAPQASRFNQGIWVQAENLVECYRDLAPLQVIGGLVYEDEANDYFLKSHGSRTPEYFWKVVITSEPKTGAPKAIAWLIPNSDDVGALDEYILSISELEERIGALSVQIDVSPTVKAMKPIRTWSVPGNCQPG